MNSFNSNSKIGGSMNLSDIVHRAADDALSSSSTGYDHRPLGSQSTNGDNLYSQDTNEQQLYNNDRHIFYASPLYKASEPFHAATYNASDASYPPPTSMESTPSETTIEPAPSDQSTAALPQRIDQITNRIPPPVTPSPMSPIPTAHPLTTPNRPAQFAATTDNPLTSYPLPPLSYPRLSAAKPSCPEQKPVTPKLVPKAPAASDAAAPATFYAKRSIQKSNYASLTVTGKNVTGETIEDGYIQFVLHHDPSYIGDSLENLMFVKRKFTSVPKTGDLSYTTWDIYVLVKKLYNQEIKNWSQLVGQLGLDMSGRPQFAQRVKRWMHKYKIDCYFDYLLGNPYEFHSSDEKLSGCLMMGNNHKRRAARGDEGDMGRSPEEPNRHYKRHPPKADFTSGTRSAVLDDDDDTVSLSEDEQSRPKPILLPGSRRRLRDTDIDPQQLERTKRLERGEESAESADENNDLPRPPSPDEPRAEKEPRNGITEKRNRERTKEQRTRKRRKRSLEHNAMDLPEPTEMEEEERDELDSTSSSAPSPVLRYKSSATTRPANYRHPIDIYTPQSLADKPSSHSDGNNTLLPQLPDTKHSLAQDAFEDSAGRLPGSPVSPNQDRIRCADCVHLSDAVDTLEQSISQLTETIKRLDKRLEEETRDKNAALDRLERVEDTCKRHENVCRQYEAWRKRIAEELLKGELFSVVDSKDD